MIRVQVVFRDGGVTEVVVPADYAATHPVLSDPQTRELCSIVDVRVEGSR